MDMHVTMCLRLAKSKAQRGGGANCKLPMQAAFCVAGKYAYEWLRRLEAESLGIVHPGVLEQPQDLKKVLFALH